MQTQVYTIYNRDPLPRDIDLKTLSGVKALGWPQQYEVVAQVMADDIDEASFKTQHLECAWWENDGVTKAVENARSTSIGDVILTPNNHLMVVAQMGFNDLSEIMAGHILYDAEQAIGMVSTLDECADTAGTPGPKTIAEYLYWLEKEVQMQASLIAYSDHPYRQEYYVKTLAGIAIELRVWGFVPALPPDALYVVVNESTLMNFGDQGEHHLMPGEEPHTYGCLATATAGQRNMMDEQDHTITSAPIYYLVPVPQTAVITAIHALQKAEA